MSIPPASPYVVPQLIYAIGSQVSLESCMAVANGFEAGFYAMLRGGSQTTSKFVNWIRETSVMHVYRIQLLFNLINTGLIVVAAKKLLEEAQNKFAATEIDSNESSGMFASIPVALGVTSTVALAVYLIHRFLSKPAEPSQTVGQVEISETTNFQQKVAKVLQITKLVITLALAFFTKNPVLLALSAGAAAYSLYKNMDIKWMTFSRTFPYWSNNPQVPVTQLKATYNVLALPLDEQVVSETCEICQDRDEQVDMAFCTHHVFHRACVADLAVSKSDSFIDNPKILKTATDHYNKNGFYTHTSHDYSISVSEDNFPACPVCQEIPFHNGCEIEVTDAVHGHFDASVTIERPPTNRQYLFENLYAIYNVAQAALAYLQTYSELAGAIFTIQKVMVIFDVIGYAMTAYYLYKNLNEKFNAQDKLWIKLAIVASLVAFAAVSYFAVLQINAYLKSAVVLKELLGQLDLSPDMLNLIEIDWKGPLSHQLMQTLYVNRIVSYVALSFFSDQWKTNLLSVAAQLGSFIGISNLNWIEISQTFVTTSSRIKSFSVTCHFLVDRVCAAPGHLLSSLQSVINYTSRFFEGSTWQTYWREYYYENIKITSKLYYSFYLHQNPIESCTCGLIPTLTEYAVSVIDAFYGTANVELHWQTT